MSRAPGFVRAWRLHRDGPAPGPWNMALDQVALASAELHGIATLRLYTWSGPWLSLGYAQQPDPELLARCHRVGVGVVRRPTGGRAVLHGADLTYSLAAPAAWLPSGLEASYRVVTDALLEALTGLGLEGPERAPAASAGSGAEPSFDCFAAAGTEEIHADGRKLVGSAQRRSAHAVLQHGSLRVSPDPPEAVRAAGLAGAATSLAELGYPGGRARLEDALIACLGRALGAHWVRGRWRPEELAIAREGQEAPNLGGFRRFPPPQEPH